MKERFRRKQLSALKGILTIIALFVCIFILNMVMEYLGYVLDVSFMEYIEYALFILIGIVIIRNWITEYEYAVIDDTFYVDRYIGKRPRRLFDIKLFDITYIGAQPPQDLKCQKQRLTYQPKRKGVVYIVYQSGGQEKCAYFSPSQKLLDKIEERRPKKSNRLHDKRYNDRHGQNGA